MGALAILRLHRSVYDPRDARWLGPMETGGEAEGADDGGVRVPPVAVAPLPAVHGALVKLLVVGAEPQVVASLLERRHHFAPAGLMFSLNNSDLDKASYRSGWRFVAS